MLTLKWWKVSWPVIHLTWNYTNYTCKIPALTQDLSHTRTGGLLVFPSKCLHMFSTKLCYRWQCRFAFYIFRSFRPSQPYQFAGHQHDTGRRRPGDNSPELDPARGAGYSYTSLQSVLELDCALQVYGAIQEEKEKDHPWGNLVTLS